MNEKDEVIRKIITKCSLFLSQEALSRLEKVLLVSLYDYSVTKQVTALSTEVLIPNEKYLNQFLAIKKVAGLSEKSLKAYQTEINMMFSFFSNKAIKEITTNDLRFYLASQQMERGLSNVYVDTKLRYLKSFFKTLRIEGLIASDPTERIAKIKCEKVIKKPFTDIELEQLRKEASKDVRTAAIVEFLASTGCRVSEVSGANRTDIKDDRLIITGKGNKQRYVYLNARAQLSIYNYLSTRKDDNEALFVGCRFNSEKQVKRLGQWRIEQIIRELGKAVHIDNCHPHRFRRTTATQALKNGMPIEQVSLMLGHEELSTTQIYARSDETDIHSAHKKYVR